jgi:hypothetical protein
MADKNIFLKCPKSVGGGSPSHYGSAASGHEKDLGTFISEEKSTYSLYNNKYDIIGLYEKFV